MTVATKPETPTFTFLSPTELCMMAVASVGLKMNPKFIGRSVPLTDPIAEVVLTDEVLKHLSSDHYRIGPNVDPGGNNVWSIIDEVSNPRLEDGWTGTLHWNFPLKMENNQPRTIRFGALVHLNDRSRGVSFRVQANCNGIVAPGTPDSHQRMLDSLMRFVDPKVEGYQILQRMHLNDGNALVSWTDLGFGGLREIGALFSEWCRGSTHITRLAQSTMSPFDPAPFDSSIFRQARFVPETEHLTLFETWAHQRDELLAKL